MSAGGDFGIYSKFKAFISCVISLAMVVVAVYCVSVRMTGVFANDDVAVAAAALTMSKGSYDFEENPTQAPATLTVNNKQSEEESTEIEFTDKYYNSLSEHKGEEKYPIYTKQYTDGGLRYGNFYVKNSTDYKLNIGELLKESLGFKMENTDEVQVLIYHTHTCESYMDRDVGYYYESFYPRTSDSTYNVTQVGKKIAEELKSAGIGVVHDTTIHDLSYNGSYSRSRETVEENLSKYPNIKVTIDIHRDSIGSDQYKVKPTFTYNGKKAAQIMIMTGYDADGSYNFSKWNYNLRFALKLQQCCENNFQGMTRPLNFGNFVYNMNVNTGSLLIEVGTDSNTLAEAMYSGELLGKALAEVLQNNM